MSKFEASNLIVLASVVELASRLLIGVSSDLWKSQKSFILLISFFVSLVVGITVSFVASPHALVAHAVFFGLLGGTFSPFMIPMMVEIVPMERMGSATGLFPFLTGTGASIGPPILGEKVENLALVFQHVTT